MEVRSVDADVLQGTVVEPGEFPIGLPGFIPAARPPPAIRYCEPKFRAGRVADGNCLEWFHRCVPFSLAVHRLSQAAARCALRLLR